MNALDAQTICTRRPNVVHWHQTRDVIDDIMLYKRIIPYIAWHSEPVILYTNTHKTLDTCLAQYAVLFAAGKKRVYIMCKDSEQVETYVGLVNDAMYHLLGESVAVSMPRTTAGFHWNNGCCIEIGPVRGKSSADILVFPHVSPEALELIVYGHCDTANMYGNCYNNASKRPCIVAYGACAGPQPGIPANGLPDAPYFEWSGPTAGQYRVQAAERKRIMYRAKLAASEFYANWYKAIDVIVLAILLPVLFLGYLWIESLFLRR